MLTMSLSQIRTPPNHHTYDYYDVHIRFNMIFNDLSNRVVNIDIYHWHAALVDESCSPTLDKLDHSNDLEKSFLHQKIAG